MILVSGKDNENAMDSMPGNKIKERKGKRVNMFKYFTSATTNKSPRVNEQNIICTKQKLSTTGNGEGTGENTFATFKEKT